MLGREVIVTLIEGTALRGTVTWCWYWGQMRFKDVSALGGEEPLVLSGAMLVPCKSVLTVQVV